MKKCTECKIEKDLLDFAKNKVRSDGYQNTCKLCNKRYRDNNKEKIDTYQKEYYNNNVDKISKRKREYHKTYYLENKEIINFKHKKYRDDNKEKKSIDGKIYYQLNKNKINSKRLAKRKEDLFLNIKSKLSSRLRSFLKYKGLNKNCKFKEYIGCDKETLIKYLESQFQPGMTWENNTQQGWHIDHKIPLASAQTEEELYKLCHYTNLQPLWATDNLRKGGRY